MTTHRNRLGEETSPYLLQHAHNPVDWFAWSEAAFAKARAEDKPIFLSIGYAACHWCHVMERESFENEAVAAYLNEHFVSIKVDREERPDLDAIYMQAVQMMSGSGGWPLTAFLTPAGQPFFGGTYFPPDNRYGRIGFSELLRRIQQVWTTQREQVNESSRALTEAIAGGEETQAPEGDLSFELLTEATRDLARRYDATEGGFGGAPKFPPSMAIQLLLAEAKRTGELALREMAEHTLVRMAAGGMYDQLGGGFHRYSTDAQWLAPHFEKMLYDNALLAQAYLDGALATGNADFERIARETLDYVLREMRGTEGGFYSSQDADSEGVEGKYYVWTPEEVEAVLGAEDGKLFCDYYDVPRGGNWHEGDGASILHVEVDAAAFAQKHGFELDVWREKLGRMHACLLEVRAKRIPPLTDGKVLSGWNGLMISAMARGTQVTGDLRYADAARRAAQFILKAMRSAEGDLLHTWRSGRASIPAFLEDYAPLILGLIDLYETTFEADFLREADRLAGRMMELFWDEAGGGFYATDGRDASLIARGKEFYDGATPSGNAMAVQALLRLETLLGKSEYGDAARRTLALTAAPMRQLSMAHHEMLRAAGRAMEGAVEVAIVTGSDSGIGAKEAREILQALWRKYLPYRAIALGIARDAGAELDKEFVIELLDNRPALDGKITIYVCHHSACAAPVHCVGDLNKLIESDI